jgi:hypothetical protein
VDLDDARDPLARALATPLAARAGDVPSTAAPAAQVVTAELEQMLVRLARRAQWGGDGRRATARIELEAGSWRGAVVTVHADSGREVSVEVELPAGVGDGTGTSNDWTERIRARLLERGFSVGEVSVH